MIVAARAVVATHSGDCTGDGDPYVWPERCGLGTAGRPRPVAEERLQRLKDELERSELGALLTFDFSNIRYMTSTHIGTWAMDKLIRFALLPRGGEPVVWDFGSAAATPSALQPLARR